MPALRILLADDESVIRMLVERIFARREETVRLTVDAAEAIEALGEETFDVVVTDIRMPGGGGAAVARAARASGVPTVFITGYADSGEIQEFLDRGAPLVRKPFAPNDLIAVIARAAASGREASSG